MEQWIFISNENYFFMKEWLKENECVEFFQKNKVHVNDIVYLYTTAPVKRIEFKMIVEKVNVNLEDMIDDSKYDIRKEPIKHLPSDKFIRLRLIKKANTPMLHLSYLRKLGLKSSMQSNLKVSGKLLEYIESFF